MTNCDNLCCYMIAKAVSGFRDVLVGLRKFSHSRNHDPNRLSKLRRHQTTQSIAGMIHLLRSASIASAIW